MRHKGKISICRRILGERLEDRSLLAPLVASVTFNQGWADPADLSHGKQPASWIDQRSDLRSIDVIFSEAILDVRPADLRLKNLGGNSAGENRQSIPLAADQLQTVGNTVRIVFEHQQLPDGNYQLEVLETVRGADGAPAEYFRLRGNSENRFHKLNGDFNGDGGVSIFDFPTFSYWFSALTGQAGPAPEYVDLDGDGGIAILDFIPFARNFGASVVDVVEAPQYTVNQPPRLQLGNAPLPGFPGSEFDQVEVLWQTIPAGPGTCDSFVAEYRAANTGAAWSPAPSPVESLLTGSENRILHTVLIHGLMYDRDYEYRISHLRGDVLVKTYEAAFHTRLRAGDATPFSFVAYGDSANAIQPAAFDRLSQRLSQIDAPFAILTGDNVYEVGSHQDLDGRFDPNLAPNAVQYISNHIEYVGFGNHDIVDQQGQPSEDSFSVPIPVAGANAPFAPPLWERPEHNYSFDYGDVHFVTFDTNSLDDPLRLSAQLDWVFNDLNSSSARWKIVFGHHPVAGLLAGTPQYYDQVLSRLGPAGAGADLFLVGHSHTYSWTFPLTGSVNGQPTFVGDWDRDYDKGAGLVQVVSGMGGNSPHVGDSFLFPCIAAGFTATTFPPSRWGFARIDVTSTRLRVSYVAADDGAVIDSFTITDLSD